MRILVVDDDVDNVELLKELFIDDGHQARIALDGPCALQTAQTFEPQVAVLDIGLPGMNGFELAGQLRAKFGSAIRLVALSGYANGTASETSFDQFLVKPVSLEALDALLASLH